MKRIISALLLLGMLASAALGGAEAAKPETTCSSLAEAVLASAEFRELTDMTERYLEKYLFVAPEDLDEWVFKRDATRGTLKVPDVSPKDYPGEIFPDGC